MKELNHSYLILLSILLLPFNIKADSRQRSPAMAASRPQQLAGTTAVVIKKERQPAAIAPVSLPKDLTLPKSVPLYPGATAVAFQPAQTSDHRSTQVGQFYSKDPIEKVAAFYSPKVVNDAGKSGLQIHRIPPQYRFSQGWFTTIMRGPFQFRVFLMWPVFQPGLSTAQTEIKFFMERR